ncbi:MAG: hypothetical protein JW751_30330 [Polyangiaceae bacterium]|nr:hypothetical protein [Polyangiaceae bacterium]
MRFLLLDANVLIDFFDVEPTLFRAIASGVGKLQVASPILREVAQLPEAEAQRLGITIVDPPIEMLATAATGGGALSFEDRLCLELARAEGWTCVTNDGALRRACEDAGIAILWGLELIAMTVEAGALTADDAADIGRSIAASNRFITDAVLDRFLRRIGRRGRPSPRCPGR